MAATGAMFTSLPTRPPVVPFAANAANGVANPATSTGANAAFSSTRAPIVSGLAPDTRNPFTGSGPIGLQNPGNNMVNPGYSEQGLNRDQNRLNQDPFADTQANLAKQAQNPSAGQNYINQNLGSLDGPGQGDQYWNQVQGQFQSPFEGENFARQSTQNYSPTGPSSAFNQQAQGQYDQFTGFTGPGNTQGQYGQSSGELAGGTQGENTLGSLSGEYNNIGQYNGPNNAAGQYQQTQGAFGDMPIANFDPFYDRARQLGVQSYNQGAAGRGVYGSSEALSGVGNVITDIEAQRANRSFDAEMQRAQEQRMRQETLGTQARNADISGTDAFGANLKGAETFGNIANMQATQTLNRNQLLGNMANQADTQALGVQNANISGMNALDTAANNADTGESRRYEGSNTAMNNADQTQIDRVKTGADIADMTDDNRRDDYRASTDAANTANDNSDQAINTASNVAHTGSADDLARLRESGSQEHTAESDRQDRVQSQVDAIMRRDENLGKLIGEAQNTVFKGSQEDFENWVTSEYAPALNAANMSESEKQQALQTVRDAYNAYHSANS